MKKHLYTTPELLLTILFCFVIFFFFIIKPNILSLLTGFSAIFGVLSSFFILKGHPVNFLYDILSYIFYIFISYKEKYLGEIILSIIIIFLHIVSLYEWKNHYKNKTLSIKKLSSKKLFHINITLFILFIFYYPFLTKIKSNLPLLNTLSTLSYLGATYLCFYRSSIQFYYWILYQISYITLWLNSYFLGNSESIILLLGSICELLLHIISIKNWEKIYNKQIPTTKL